MKKILTAILSSIIITSACMAPAVSAEKSDMITDLSEIQTLLSDFVIEEELPFTGVHIDENVIPSCVMVTFKWADYTFGEAVYQYAEEKNIDKDLVTCSYCDYPIPILGDANKNRIIDVRDCAYIALKCAKDEYLSKYYADFNNDNVVNIRDASAIAMHLAGK